MSHKIKDENNAYGHNTFLALFKSLGYRKKRIYPLTKASRELKRNPHSQTCQMMT